MYNLVPEVKNNINKFFSKNISLEGIFQSAKENTPSASDSNAISLQQINNVGYSFYIGQIDYADAAPLSDDIKNNVTQIIYKANVPKSLLNNVAIIIVNTLAVSQYQIIEAPSGNFAMPSFTPDFMSGGGIYSQYSSKFSFIFINKTMLGNLSEILTHELGHHISSQLTDAEWTKYYQFRKIPANTARQGTDWTTSPMEDFAEVYKNVYTGLKIKTYYGLLTPSNSTLYEIACKKTTTGALSPSSSSYGESASNSYESLIRDMQSRLSSMGEDKNISNTDLQACRRDVLLHPEKYPNDWRLGTPYYSVVDQTTKDFITQIISRLN